MRILTLATAVSLATSAPVFAQQRGPDGSAERAGMAHLLPLAGNWSGGGSAMLGPGRQSTFNQTEKVENRLDGLLLVIEGHGVDSQDGRTVHHALAVISHDSGSTYSVKAYLANGQSVEASGELIEPGKFRWGFEVPGRGEVRNTLTFTDSTWREIAEFSRDGGATWMQTLEMNLSK